MLADATQETLDALAVLQLKVGIGGVARDRILATLLPPPAEPAKRAQIKRRLDDLVPEFLTRYESPGALPPAYELTRQGWLRTKHASRVLEIIKAFLDAFRDHVTSGSTTQRLEWRDLVAKGLADSDYHLACIVAKCFELQNGGATQTWDGKNPPRASFGLPIDVDELVDVVNASDLVAKRQAVSYERRHARRVITGEITGHIRRAAEHIYKIFTKTGSWPLSRTLHVQLAKDGISLERIASGRFVRGHDVHTEGVRTMLTLAGLLIPAEAEDDRCLVVQVLRFVGECTRTQPEDRTVNALTVMERVGIDEPEVIAVAKMLSAQGSSYVTTGGDTFDVAKMTFYLSPAFIAHADANDLWDIVLNEEDENRRWHRSGLEGVITDDDAIAQAGDIRDVSDSEEQPDLRYECIASLGEGVYGDAWRARDTELKRDVAIKFIRSMGASREDVLEHARALARVTDSNIVAVHHVTRVTDPVTSRVTDAVIMELVDGPSLVERLGRPLDRGEARRIGDAILSAVDAYHASGLVHLDLHDGNVIVGERAVKVIDPMYVETIALKSEATRQGQQQRELRRARDLLIDLLHVSVGLDALAIFERETMRPTIESLRHSFHGALQTQTASEGTEGPRKSNGNGGGPMSVADKRKEVIGQVYARIRRAHVAATELTHLMQHDPPDTAGREAAERARAETFSHRWEELRQYFLANALYLGERLEKLVNTYLSEVTTAVTRWRSAKQDNQSRAGVDDWASAFYGLQRIAETTLVAITREMQEVLGIPFSSNTNTSQGGAA